jgi:polyhydroxyalkanoate synthesis regulator phasin
MFKNTPFEAAAKSMMESAGKFNPAATQEAVKPMMDNLKAWGDLAQKQAQVAQAAMAESMESFKSIKEPQAAFEAMKASAENTMAMATNNLKEVTALSVAQFHATVDTLESNSPAPEAFAGVAKTMKDAVSKMETAMESAIKNSSAAVAQAQSATTTKKSRAS